MKWTAAIVLAIFSGPIVAVELQRRFDIRREKRRLKEAAFRTLMATRAPAYRRSAEHVQVLNCIELTFSDGGGDKRVREAWRAYLDMLNAPDTTDAPANERKYEQCDDAFWDLLYQISAALGYGFDRTYIKDSYYCPVAPGNTLRDQEITRNGIATVLSGKGGFPVGTFRQGPIHTPAGLTTTGLVQTQTQDEAAPGTVPPVTAVPETAAPLWHGRTL
jgi:hypothetical protein